MKTKHKAIGIFLGLVAVAVIVGILFPGEGKNETFAPQDEFRLDPWVELKLGGIDFSLNKAVAYLVIALALTVGTVLFVANRMQAKPNRVQMIVEVAYDVSRNQLTKGHMDDEMARKWFPFVGTIFLFIWFSNVIGYLPLPMNTAHPVEVAGLELPTFGIYAATANISVTLALTLMVWLIYNGLGIRQHGFIGYCKSLVPAGVNGPMAVPIFFIEVISHFVRIISLSVRLFANILAGHLLILFMGGGLAVLLGLAALGVFTIPIAIVFFIFEIGLVATLQAFIFASLTSIYIGGATAGH